MALRGSRRHLFALPLVHDRFWVALLRGKEVVLSLLFNVNIILKV